MTVGTFSGRGFEIHYEILGEGPRLLFFNGSGSSISVARPLIDALAASNTVLVHDQRGLGLSGVPDGPYEMADYALDAHALLAHVGWERTAVFGISFGGMVALEFAVTHPAMVERLCLVCTSAGGGGGSSYPLHELPEMDPDERARIYPTLVDTRFDEAWLAEHPSEAALLTPRPAPVGRAALGAFWQLDARRRHDVWERLSSLTVPTFVGSGSYDGIAPPSNGRAIAGRVADGVHEEYQGGHMFLFQDRRALPDVRAFLSNNREENQS
jgi:pimeloyl-ACP methyl ester carboxylesterase